MNLGHQARWVGLALIAVVAVLWLSPSAHTQSEKHLTVYAPGAVYSVPVISFEGRDYVGLADLLEPLGNVDAREDGKKWKLRFTPSGGRELNAEFQEGKTKGKIRGQEILLTGNFHMENGRGYVPVHNAGAIVPMLAGLAADFHEASLRLFLGTVAVRFTQTLQKGAVPKLVLSFSAPVNPMVATEPGKLRLVFRRDALVNTGSDIVQTGDPNITGTDFNDNSGIAQLTIKGAVPLTATFSEGNRVVTIAPVPGSLPAESAKAAAPVASGPSTPAPAVATPSAAAPVVPAAPPQPRFVVVIDPAHGGEERGAAITDSIQEKDVNLAFARRIQRELQNKGINVVMLRTGDNALSVDDRAVAANSARPAIYLCVHAANLGTGLRIFTALMAPAGVSTHTFLPWPQAQAPYLDLSAQVAGSISAELSNRQIAVTALPAPLRPMRNIAAPAIAVELAPPDDNAANINNAEYQQNVAAAIANGVAAMKPKVQAAR